MKPLPLSVILLTVLLILCVINTITVVSITNNVKDNLQLAITAGKDDDWEAAICYTEKTIDLWMRHKKYIDAVFPHSMTNDFSIKLLATLGYAQYERAEFVASAYESVTLISNITELELPTFDNILIICPVKVCSALP